MMVASALVPSEKSTVILPVAVAASTTWLLVRMYPSCRITNPEPVPVPEEPSTLIVTTLGRTLDAMSAMDPCGRTVEEAASASLPPAPASSPVRPLGSIADIASRILPSVVTIKVEGPAGAGTGSGFVMRQDGYILTNNHVVDAARAKGKITVLFSDGKSSDATVIGHDESYDLAVVRVDRRNLPVLVLGASQAVRVGDPVIAVGAPLGLDSSVTSGIVSALNRPVTAAGAGATSASFINAIQTDAAINPGNSGG